MWSPEIGDVTTDWIADAREAVSLDEAIEILARKLRVPPDAVADRLARLVHRQAKAESLRRTCSQARHPRDRR